MHGLDFLGDVKAYLAQSRLQEGFQRCAVRNMGLIQTRHAKAQTCSLLDPVIGLVLQGKKTVRFGRKTLTYGAGDLLVVGQSVPAISYVVEATPETPYIAVFVSLDMRILRSLYGDIGAGLASIEPSPALKTGAADPALKGAMARHFALSHDTVEEQALGAATLREIYFRTLRSPFGGTLQHLLHLDSKANRIAKAIAHIQKEYRTAIPASELASIAGMSPSVFYENFKQVTASSPLQYQKDLRLHEAHHLLQQAHAPVSRVAKAVGYESAAQFSREFSRKFGAPPKTFVGA